jgi:hypothetical protein
MMSSKKTSKMHSRLEFAGAILSLFLVFAGCAIVQPPNAEERAAIRARKHVVVLLRVSGELTDRTQVETFRMDIRDDDLSFALGGFESGGKLQRVWPRFLSTESGKQGWTYLILEPGNHYIAVLEPRNADAWSYMEKIKDDLERLKPRLLEVPEGLTLMYAGTLCLPCRSRFYLFGPKRCDSFDWDQVDTRNEEILAQELAAKYLADLGPLQTILIKPHGGPIILRTPKG